MKNVTITLPLPAATTYDVRIGPGLLAQIGPAVREVAIAPSCVLVSDSNVARHYLAPAAASLSAAGYRVIESVFDAGEANKTVATAVGVLDKALHARVERATPVIALGGGVVGDLAGFVAAVLLRGVPFIQVPTTLLAAVDASVGGKVGVDHAAGKNLIGAFHHPRLVLTDIATFATLPTRELQCGMAECVKHAVIRDASLFAFIEQNSTPLMAGDAPAMQELVERNVRIKADVVMTDPFERGIRALLNLGHTFGHALEAIGSYTGLQHGEGVALGTIAAARVAQKRGTISAAQVARIVALLERIGLPTKLPAVDVAAVYAAMGTDKKVEAGKLRLVLPKGIGDAEVVRNVPEEEIKAAIGSLIG